MVIGLALIAAGLFALGPVLQQKGAMRTPAHVHDPRFLVQLLHEPIWFLGGLAQMLGWIVQAIALDRGAVVVVQTVVTLSIVIALPMGVRITGQQVGRREYAAALTAVAGIVLFLAAGRPGGGAGSPTTTEWWTGVILTVSLIVLLGSLGRRRNGATAAALLGSAAGVCYALQATVTKQFTSELGGGLTAVLTTWTTYVLVASALVGLVLTQASLKRGTLAPSLAGSNVSTMLASVGLGILVYDETLSHGHGHLAFSVAGLAMTIGAVLVLSRPPTTADRTP